MSESASSVINKIRRERENLNKAMNILTGENKTSYDDPNIYTPSRDENGNTNVVIRFLPVLSDDDDTMHVYSYYKHAFIGDNGKWCITDICYTSLKKNCPICERNNVLWDSGTKANQDLVRARKRKKGFIANVLVVKDPLQKEKEGKVFLFKFGAAIFNKIKQAYKPAFPEEAPLSPFDPEIGADFMLRARRDPESKQLTYADSKFGQPSVMFNGDEDKIVEALNKCVDPEAYFKKSIRQSEERIEEMAEYAYCKVLPNFRSGSKSASTNVGMKKEEPQANVPNFDEPKYNKNNGSEEDSLAAFRNMVNSLEGGNDSVPF